MPPFISDRENDNKIGIMPVIASNFCIYFLIFCTKKILQKLMIQGDWFINAKYSNMKMLVYIKKVFL